MPSSPMEANADKNQDKGGKKLSRVGSWGTMGFYSSSSSCAGSICSTKESSVSTRGGRRRSSCGGDGGGSTSSRSLMAPDYSYSGLSSAAVSASSSFNSEMTAATSATTASSSTSPPSVLSSPLSSIGGSFRAMQIRKLSSCYQCHSVLDPRSLGAVFSCADCDEVFIKADSLELHRATRHAVSELGPEDTSRNIVEIIFQSSWLKKQGPVCKIDRILKVHSNDKTIKKFEQYKECVKERASSEAKKNPRCVADGNELLRFHCTTFTCSLGLAGGTALCSSTSPQQCKLCILVKHILRLSACGRQVAQAVECMTSTETMDSFVLRSLFFFLLLLLALDICLRQDGARWPSMQIGGSELVRRDKAEEVGRELAGSGGGGRSRTIQASRAAAAGARARRRALEAVLHARRSAAHFSWAGMGLRLTSGPIFVGPERNCSNGRCVRGTTAAASGERCAARTRARDVVVFVFLLFQVKITPEVTMTMSSRSAQGHRGGAAGTYAGERTERALPTYGVQESETTIIIAGKNEILDLKLLISDAL